MGKLRIITDHKWKQFKDRNEVPSKILKDQFDYQNENETFDGFILYRGFWYHLDQFMRIANHTDGAFSSWHGYAGDSYFSGVIIRISDDCEEYQIATYLS